MEVYAVAVIATGRRPRITHAHGTHVLDSAQQYCTHDRPPFHYNVTANTSSSVVVKQYVPGPCGCPAPRKVVQPWAAAALESYDAAGAGAVEAQLRCAPFNG